VLERKRRRRTTKNKWTDEHELGKKKTKAFALNTQSAREETRFRRKMREILFLVLKGVL